MKLRTAISLLLLPTQLIFYSALAADDLKPQDPDKAGRALKNLLKENEKKQKKGLRQRRKHHKEYAKYQVALAKKQAREGKKRRRAND